MGLRLASSSVIRVEMGAGLLRGGTDLTWEHQSGGLGPGHLPETQMGKAPWGAHPHGADSERMNTFF